MTVVTFSLEVVTIVIVPLFIINYKNAHSYNLLQTGYVCKNSITRSYILITRFMREFIHDALSYNIE